MTEQFPQEYWDKVDRRGPVILDLPENTLDHDGNEIDIVALKDRFRGSVGSPNYEYLLNVARAVGMETARDLATNEERFHRFLPKNGEKSENFAYAAAYMTAHYATWMQWVVNLPGEQWPEGHSQPEFITWAEELNAKLKGSEE